MPPELKEYPGNCHCGLFAFKIRIPELTSIQTCKCSFCLKVAFPSQNLIQFWYIWIEWYCLDIPSVWRRIVDWKWRWSFIWVWIWTQKQYALGENTEGPHLDAVSWCPPVLSQVRFICDESGQRGKGKWNQCSSILPNLENCHLTLS